jgi:hypothetical protein
MLPLLTIGRTAFTLFQAQQAAGVIGLDVWMDALGRLVPKMAVKASRRDGDALREMVELARSRVRRDTGRLYSGISGQEIDGECEFRASAIHPGTDVDYARHVEFGTAAGDRGRFRFVTAHEGLQSGNRAPDLSYRRRRSLRTHPGTPPQPYFYNSADEVLAKRNLDMQDLAEDAGSEDGWEFGN